MESVGRTCIWLVLIVLSTMFVKVYCDEKCEVLMKNENITTKFGESAGMADLAVCYELTQIKCGGNYSSSLVKKRPTLYSDIKSKCDQATVIFLGQDSNATSVLWLVSDVPTGDFQNGFHGQSGNEVMIYSGTKDIEDTTNYYIFIFCQSQTLDCPLCGNQDRSHFDVRQFAIHNGFNGLSAGMIFAVTNQLTKTGPNEDEVCRKG